MVSFVPSSKVTDVYWVFAERKIGEYPEPTFRSGKWLIFVSIHNLDRIWSKIKIATEQGKLGGQSKVTAVANH